MAAAQVSLFSKENGIDVIKECFEKSRFSSYAKIVSREDMINEKTTLDRLTRSYRSAAGRACGKVNAEYASASFNAALVNPSMDMLVVKLKSKSAYSVVLGFVIPQLGECRMLPNTWSINLICGTPLVQQKSGSKKDKLEAEATNEDLAAKSKGLGGFLLAATMLAAKRFYASRGIQPAEMILELAGSYGNASGLTSYTKLGFVKDLTLFYEETPANCLSWDTRNCFCEENTLPMKSNLDLFTENDLKSILEETYNYRNILDNERSGMLNASRNIFKNSINKGLDQEEKKSIEAKTDECAALTNSMLSVEKKIADLQNRRDKMGIPIPQDKLKEHREALTRISDNQRLCLQKIQKIADDLRVRPIAPKVQEEAKSVPPPAAPSKKRKDVEEKQEEKDDGRPRTRAYALRSKSRSKSGARCGARSDWDYSGMKDSDRMHHRSSSRRKYEGRRHRRHRSSSRRKYAGSREERHRSRSSSQRRYGGDMRRHSPSHSMHSGHNSMHSGHNSMHSGHNSMHSGHNSMHSGHNSMHSGHNSMHSGHNMRHDLHLDSKLHKYKM